MAGGNGNGESKGLRIAVEHTSSLDALEEEEGQRRNVIEKKSRKAAARGF